MKRTPNNPRTFPKPDKTWATWSDYRDPGNEFVMHVNMTQVKQAVGRCTDYYGQLYRDVYIYSWNGSEWVEEFKLKKGLAKANHPLWKRQPRSKFAKLEPASEDDVDAAIASILGGS